MNGTGLGGGWEGVLWLQMRPLLRTGEVARGRSRETVATCALTEGRSREAESSRSVSPVTIAFIERCTHEVLIERTQYLAERGSFRQLKSGEKPADIELARSAENGHDQETFVGGLEASLRITETEGEVLVMTLQTTEKVVDLILARGLARAIDLDDHLHAPSVARSGNRLCESYTAKKLVVGEGAEDRNFHFFFAGHEDHFFLRRATRDWVPERIEKSSKRHVIVPLLPDFVNR